ncbi:LOW QUALITY PROTEIN: hypothetical protein PHMEG_00017921 [Phytophthora megakarya]|uniref:Uncharacterized protein n=1 Tax=Phytophthora megakarya TaxID=4795 RepID=A0A225VVB8_9STRA|nr:LOW QUALITY PROTEIN: hypothetical protein PHMEG_00017921 [Phytophthora megakarya]
MIPGEINADFVSALQDLCGNNRIKEHVLLKEFYCSVDRTTRALVKQYRPGPSMTRWKNRLKLAIIFTTWIEAWKTLDKILSVSGTTGHIAMIPGVGRAVITEEENLALFTNPRGIYNTFLGLYEAPRGRTWNGTIWAPPSRKHPAPAAAATPVSKIIAAANVAGKKARLMMVVATDDAFPEIDDDSETAVPYAHRDKKQNLVSAATRQAKAVEAPREKLDQKPPLQAGLKRNATRPTN